MKDKVRVTSITGENEDSSFIVEQEDENGTNVHASEPTLASPQIAKTPSSVLRKRKAPVAATETASSTLMKHILEEEKKMRKEEPKSEMDLFFDSIKMTVNKFSAYDQFLTKQKIFQIVTEIEAKYMYQYWNQPPNYPHIHQQQFTHPTTSAQSYLAPSPSISTRPTSAASSVQETPSDGVASPAASFLETFSP